MTTEPNNAGSQGTQDHPIIFFDGVCNLCEGSVQFIIKRDPAGQFRFAALQSEVAQRILSQHQVSSELRSIVLLDGGTISLESDAVLRIGLRLSGYRTLSQLGLLVPRAVRDLVYRFVAARRYRWFGKQEVCMVPTAELRGRFL
jgi:predicted DCC family thiol-disulfide oxidoreductase YuxK